MPDRSQQILANGPTDGHQPSFAEGLGKAEQTSSGHRGSEIALVIGFLLVIAIVPVVQIGIELARNERVQFTDVFRSKPTSKSLRLFESTLKEKSWFNQVFRPRIQQFLFATLRDTGAKGILGRDQWLFYRPDIRYLLEPDRAEQTAIDSRWVKPTGTSLPSDAVVRAIVRFRDQLKERGITLVVVPVPGKPSVYPDQVSGRLSAGDQHFRSATLDLLSALESQGVPTVNLFAAFSAARTTPANANNLLYLARDTHWTPLGARLAARAVATRLVELNLAPIPAKEFQQRTTPVRRWGDVLEMMQIPGLHKAFAPEEVICEQVIDPVLGPLVPTGSDRPGTYRYPGQKAAVLVLGDSFTRIYQYGEPRSLGEVPGATQEALPGARTEATTTKRLLPGSAGWVSQLALALKAPVDSIYSDGGASTDVRRQLSTNPEILEGKKVVIWEFVERDVALGKQGWEDTPLPPKLD